MIKNIKNHIIVKDNFLPKNTFLKIKNEISKFNYVNRFSINEHNNTQKYYFEHKLDKKYFSVQKVINKINKLLDVDLDFINSYYWLTVKHTKPSVHTDTANINCCIYIKGDNYVNNGTGFYDLINGQHVLNSHVGFKENRAIIFDSKILHASLLFHENSSPRYIMTTFFKYKK
jgi:hypothetical protein